MEVYLIVWRNFNICKDSIESFIDSTSEPLEITVANPNDDLPNSGTSQIREYLKDMVNSGKIKRALLFSENCFGWGLMNSIRDFPPKQALFTMSDGDLILPKDVDWVGLSRKYHEGHWVVTGCNLSYEGYAPANWGFSKEDDNFGMWLQTIKTEWFMNHHGLEKNCIDSDIMTIARHTGGATKIREIEAVHATWSIHYPESRYYDKEYSELKRQQGSNWVFRERPLNMNYELIGER